MLTLFTTTKPFEGKMAVIQRNAIRSWQHLGTAQQILVFGDAEGTAAECERLGVEHIPDVEINDEGTPLVSTMFAEAEERARSDLYCYVNADILLLADFDAATRKMAGLKSFLMVGRRWDSEVTEPLDFDLLDWGDRLAERARHDGDLHSATGIDYFVYPRGFWGSIPPFAIGRTAWDNWLIYRARALRARVVDATDAVTAVHQNHAYAHHPQGSVGVWEGDEAKRNLEHAVAVRVHEKRQDGRRQEQEQRPEA